MFKNMKNAVFESSNNGSFNKHGFVQQYHKLQKETEMAKNKLQIMNQRKLTLLAEVRFLRRRHKHLLQLKAVNPQGKKLQQLVLQTQNKSSMKEKYGGRKEVKRQSSPGMWDLKMKDMGSSSRQAGLKPMESYVVQKEKKKNGREASLRNKNLGVDLNLEEGMYRVKEVAFQHPSEVPYLKEKECFYVGKETNAQMKILGFDLNRMEMSYAVKEEEAQTRAPVFDLNLKLDEEEEEEEEDLQESHEAWRSEESKNMLNAGNGEQLNDLKLPICRNLEIAPICPRKRKISWQDQVALKV